MKNEELVLVIAILGVIIAMVAVMLGWQRRKLRRLSRAETIIVSIESVGRGVLVALPSLCVVPVAVGVVAHASDPWMRGHALGAVLTSIVGGLIVLAAAMLATARFRAIGALTLAPNELRLSLDGHDDLVVPLEQPFQLDEAWVIAPNGVPHQIVVVGRQQQIAFMYALGIAGHGKRRGTQLNGPVGPALGSEARIIHERLLKRSAQKQAVT